jgi:hypothetical protein
MPVFGIVYVRQNSRTAKGPLLQRKTALCSSGEITNRSARPDPAELDRPLTEAELKERACGLFMLSPHSVAIFEAKSSAGSTLVIALRKSEPH